MNSPNPDVTITELQDMAKWYLAHVGFWQVAEAKRRGEPEVTSVNDTFGLAARLLAEQAEHLQRHAATEERHGR